jgi:multiple sugar transport system permease protein
MVKKKQLLTSRAEAWLTGYLFVLPILILMGLWFYFPIFSTLRYSFTSANMLSLQSAMFVGLDNYGKLLGDSGFQKSLIISLVLTLAGVPCVTFFSLVTAVCINSITRGRAVFRSIYYLPYITSPVAVTTVFSYLFMQDGLFTKFFSFFGFPNVTWFSNVDYALPFLIILFVWTYLGFFTVIYIGALQGIPDSVLEGVRIDGASGFQTFFYIIVPMLRLTTVLVVLSSTIYSLQFFEQPYALARGQSLGYPAGATGTVTIFFYSQAFKFFKVGYGSAAAFIIFILILSFALIQNRLTAKWENDV